MDDEHPSSLFDVFYEDFLRELLSSSSPNSETMSNVFSRKKTDIERVEYLLQNSTVISNFKVRFKCGIKREETSVRYREEGNRLFGNEQFMESLLFYNKAISYAPHPSSQDCSLPDLSSTLPYSSLSLCYANRSATLRKLFQYDDCLRDIHRALRFGYPEENVYKLWERKGKCYFALKKFDMAAKCLRQSLVSLKNTTLSGSQKLGKTTEIQALLKEWKKLQILSQLGDSSSSVVLQEEESPILMGATGPLIFIPDDPIKKDKKVAKEEAAAKKEEAAAAAAAHVLQRSQSCRANRPGNIEVKKTSFNLSGLKRSLDDAQNTSNNKSLVSLNTEGKPLQKTGSVMSISNLSGRPTDVDVPELSYGSNPRMPSASLAIDLKFSPEKGRYFVATQNLIPGDVILREEPYAAVLESIFRVNHCGHCLRKTSTPIPCYECTTVQYCGEICRERSWNAYHKTECGILRYLEPSRYLGKLPHLALRIVTKTGMKDLIEYSMASLLPSEDTVTHFDPSSYKSVHNLASNTDKRPFEDLIKKAAIALFMVRLLAFNGFFKETESQEEYHTSEVFISSLLLRHLQIASTNGLEMAECILKNNDVRKFNIIPVGGAIFPTLSFFNHSCYPNSVRLGYQNFQVVRVVRPVCIGEEVNIDYGFDFYATTFEARQHRSKSQYYFSCNCIACKEGWPSYNELLNKPRTYKIPVTQNLSSEIQRQMSCYITAMSHLVKLEINEALVILKEYLLVVGEFIKHPDPQYIDCEEAYKQCLWLEGRGYKAKNSSFNL